MDSKGHVWYTNREMGWMGEPDEPAYIEQEDSYCAGFQCKVCGYWFCIHCHLEPPEKCEGDDECLNLP